MKAHEFPKPLYHPNKPGEIFYAASQREVDRVKKEEGWVDHKITTKFPLALHAAPHRRTVLSAQGVPMELVTGQGITVYDEQQLQTALKNGWSTKPVIDEAPQALPASADRPPLPVDESSEVPVHAAAARGGDSPRRRASA